MSRARWAANMTSSKRLGTCRMQSSTVTRAMATSDFPGAARLYAPRLKRQGPKCFRPISRSYDLVRPAGRPAGPGSAAPVTRMAPVRRQIGQGPQDEGPARPSGDAAGSPCPARRRRFPHENQADRGRSAGPRWARSGPGRRPPRPRAARPGGRRPPGPVATSATALTYQGWSEAGTGAVRYQGETRRTTTPRRPNSASAASRVAPGRPISLGAAGSPPSR